MRRALPAPLRPLPAAVAPGAGVDWAFRWLRELGTDPISWSNGPGDRYPAHDHGFTKLLVCVEGSITFLVGADALPVELHAGDGFELPPGTRHAATVGPLGCTCAEGHRP